MRAIHSRGTWALQRAAITPTSRTAIAYRATMGLSHPRRTWALRSFTPFQGLSHLDRCWRDGRSPAPSTCKAGYPSTAWMAVMTSLVSAGVEGFSAALANRGHYTEKGLISRILESLTGLPASGLAFRGATPPYRKLA